MPPNAALIALAMLLTAFVMDPAGRQAYTAGLAPLREGEIERSQALEKAAAPFRAFVLKNMRDKDLGLSLKLSESLRLRRRWR